MEGYGFNCILEIFILTEISFRFIIELYLFVSLLRLCWSYDVVFFFLVVGFGDMHIYVWHAFILSGLINVIRRWHIHSISYLVIHGSHSFSFLLCRMITGFIKLHLSYLNIMMNSSWQRQRKWIYWMLRKIPHGKLLLIIFIIPSWIIIHDGPKKKRETKKIKIDRQPRATNQDEDENNIPQYQILW